jgi:tetratricopeptide (TPR) repeat protein
MKIRLIILAIIMIIPGTVYAHPESGFLPDAIAEMEYKIVLEITPADIETRNKLGIVLYRKNKLNEAQKAFSEVLKTVPGNFDAHDGMGLVKTKEKKYVEAVKWFKKAITISNEDTMVHYHLGFAYEQLGNFIDAENSYKNALEINNTLIKKGINKETEISKKETLLSALKNLQAKIKAVTAGKL